MSQYNAFVQDAVWELHCNAKAWRSGHEALSPGCDPIRPPLQDNVSSDAPGTINVHDLQ